MQTCHVNSNDLPYFAKETSRDHLSPVLIIISVTLGLHPFQTPVFCCRTTELLSERWLEIAAHNMLASVAVISGRTDAYKEPSDREGEQQWKVVATKRLLLDLNEQLMCLSCLEHLQTIILTWLLKNRWSASETLMIRTALMMMIEFTDDVSKLC